MFTPPHLLCQLVPWLLQVLQLLLQQLCLSPCCCQPPVCAAAQHGAGALDTLVTLDWVHVQMRPQLALGQDLRSMLSRGFFVGPRDFRLHLSAPDAPPVMARLHLGTRGWRLNMLYY